MSDYNRNLAANAANSIRERLRAQNLARLEGAKPVDPATATIEQATTPTPVPVRKEVNMMEDSVKPVEQPEPEVAVAAPAEPEVDYKALYEAMEQKYKSADGMMKQQGSEFRRKNAEAEARWKEAEKEANDLRARMEALEEEATRNRPVTQDDVKRYFTPEQIERLGEDECRDMLSRQRMMVEDHSKVTRASIQKELKAAQAGIESEKQSLAELRRNQFTHTVDSLVPDWREIDNSPEFISWLEEVDPLSGMTRRDLGVSASNALDAKRFAAVYTAFKSTQAKPASVAPLKRVLPNGVPPVSAPTTEPEVKPMSAEEMREYKNRQARGYYHRNPGALAKDQARYYASVGIKK